MKNNVVRLSNIVYGNSSETQLNKKDLIIRTIVFMLYEKKNEKITLADIVEYFQSKHYLEFIYTEILELIKSNLNLFTINMNDREWLSEIQLVYKVYIEYCELIKNEDEVWNKLIEDFIMAFDIKVDYKYASELLIKYIYHIMNISNSELSKLIDTKMTYTLKDISNEKFSNDDIFIIDSFLNWKDERKNVQLLKLISLALDYSFVNCENTEISEIIKPKKMLIDTNVIYRLIGINGKFRKESIIRFFNITINKMNFQYYITQFTDAEFFESIDSQMKFLKEILNGRKIEPDLFRKYVNNDGLYRYYSEWCEKTRVSDLTIFKASIISDYRKVIEEYTFDKKITNIQLSEEDIDKISEYSTSYFRYLPDAFDKNSYIIGTDMRNYRIVEKRRNDVKNIFDTEHFILTTDKKLRKWEYQVKNHTPIHTIPSQWLSIYLKYGSRTDDDFSSLISFFNLKQVHKSLTEKELVLICEGIDRVNSVIKKDGIVDSIITNDFLNQAKELSDSEILNISEKATRDYLEKELIEKEEENERLKKKVMNDKEPNHDILREQNQIEKERLEFEKLKYQEKRDDNIRVESKNNDIRNIDLPNWKFRYISIGFFKLVIFVIVGLAIYMFLSNYIDIISKDPKWTLIVSLFATVIFAILGSLIEQVSPISHFVNYKKCKMEYLKK